MMMTCICVGLKKKNKPSPHLTGVETKAEFAQLVTHGCRVPARTRIV